MSAAADWGWAGPPVDLRPLFPVERAEFTSLLRGLDPADWERSTVCPGWQVHDVVAHVLHDYIRKLSGSRDGQAMSGPQPGESLPAYLARANQDFADTAASWSPRVLIDLIGHLGPQLDELWAGCDMDRLGWTVSWADPDRPAPVWLDVAREYSEYWVHQQQVRDAVGRPGADGRQLAGPVTDTFLRAVPYTLRELARPPGSAVHIRVTGPGGGDWTALRGADTWAVDRGEPAGRPAARVEISFDGLWRVATRGIAVDAALRQATISGDQVLGAAVLHLVSIVR